MRSVLGHATKFMFQVLGQKFKKKWENLFFSKDLCQKCPIFIRKKAYGIWIKINSIFRLKHSVQSRDPAWEKLNLFWSMSHRLFQIHLTNSLRTLGHDRVFLMFFHILKKLTRFFRVILFLVGHAKNKISRKK